MVLYVHHKSDTLLGSFFTKISFLNVSNNYVLHCLSVVYVLKLIHYQINILARTFSLKKKIERFVVQATPEGQCVFQF